MSQHLEVNWAEGLFLRPHHLQQASRRQQALLGEEIALARPYAWGLRQIDIAEAELETEVLSVRRCNLRMRDGTRLIVPDNGELEPRNFKEALNESDGSLAVYIGIPLVRDREPNTLMPHDDGDRLDRRYRASTLQRPDENTGDNLQQIEVRKYNPRILFSGEEMAGYELLKICHLTRSGFDESRPVISREFVPPLLELAAWPMLHDSIQDHYHQLVAKNRSLAAMVAGRKVAFGSEGVGGAEAMLKLSITNRSVGFFKQFANAPSIHPFDMYIELCRLAGELAVFDASRMIPDLPLYNHDDLGRCYRELLAALDKLVNNLLPTTYLRRRFEPAGDLLEAMLDDDWLAADVEFYLGIESEHDLDVIDREHSFLKMASPDGVDRLINRRLPGLMGRRIHRVPVGLPDRPDMHYFKIHREGEYWDDVARSKNLACHGLNDANLELYLYVLLKTAAGE